MNKRKRKDCEMSLSSIFLIILAFLIIIAFFILYKTRKRLKEIDGFRTIKEPGDNSDDVIDSFGE